MKQANLLLLLTALRMSTILATPLPSENIILPDFQLSPAPSNDLTAFSTNYQPDLQLENYLLGSSSSIDGTPSTVGGQGTISSSWSQYPQENNQLFAATPDLPTVGKQAPADVPSTPTNNNLAAPAPTPAADRELFCSETAKGSICEGMRDMNTVVKKDGSTSTCEAAVFNCPKGLHEFIMKACPIVQKAPPSGLQQWGCNTFGICL
ncbi:hypothetical protein MMC31_003620 [Peltigera leucophlebia]|nr:hypothetical protein [Peltigera leucophlebia]